MLHRDLRLPNGKVMLLLSGEIVERPPRTTDITWDELSGSGIYNPCAGSKQPFVGCRTGGDKIADRLMQWLKEP